MLNFCIFYQISQIFVQFSPGFFFAFFQKIIIMSSPSLKTTFKELEKYVKHMFFKTSQIIIQSRQGGKSSTESQPNPKVRNIIIRNMTN